jgi:hypothetical protein
MTLYICNKILDYWDIRNFTPICLIAKEISRDRFQELHMRVRLVGRDAISPYAKVSYSSYFGMQINS